MLIRVQIIFTRVSVIRVIHRLISDDIAKKVSKFPASGGKFRPLTQGFDFLKSAFVNTEHNLFKQPRGGSLSVTRNFSGFNMALLVVTVSPE